METYEDPRLQRIQQHLSLEAWSERVKEAERKAEVLDRLLKRRADGASMAAAVREEGVDGDVTTWLARAKRYEASGTSGLIDRRFVLAREKMTPEVVGMVRGLLRGDPTMRAAALCNEVEAALGVHVGGSTMRDHLKREGLSHAVGRPAGRKKGRPVPLAGAELLKGLEAEVGAVARLTRDVEQALEHLPESEFVIDDKENRDERGRFLPEYNQGQERGAAAIGPKFETVDIQRQGKDLPGMRVACSSYASLYRKNMALVMMPCVTDSPRWSALRHWQGGHLEELVGHAYQPAR